MKSIVSFQLLNNPVSTVKPDLGFIKLFFKNNILTSKDSSNVEKNLVLDTLLTGLSISPVAIPIVATDSIIQAFGKLQGTINNLAGGVQSDWDEVNPLLPSYIQNKPTIPADISDLTDTTGIIPNDISDLTDTTGIIPIAISDLTNDTGFITLTDIPTIPTDINELTDLTNIIPQDISDLTDTTNIIPTNTSDLTNDSGFIVIGDVPNTIVANDDVDDTNIAIGKILQVGADGVTHEYVDPPTSGGGTSYERKSDYVASTFTLYQGYAVQGSSQIDAVWTITKIITNATGDVVNSPVFINVKWSDRYTL